MNSNVHGGPLDHDQEALALWKRRWLAAGFEANILTEKDAQKHPRYPEFLSLFHDLPTVNSKQYEVSCYVRYLALASVGGGLMVDYDVLPLNAAFESLQLPEKFTVWDRGAVPCMVSGTAEQFTAAAEYMAYFNFSASPSFQNGRPHTSDMYIMQHMAKKNLVETVPCIIPSIKRMGCGAPALLHGLPPACAGAPVALHFSHHAVAEALGFNPVGPFNAHRNRLISQYFHERKHRCGSRRLGDVLVVADNDGTQ
eukprot:EG_transcript_20294